MPIERRPGYMILADGTRIELGDYVSKISTSSVHKQPNRPKPKPVSSSPTPLIGDVMTTSYGDIAYKSDPTSPTIYGPASILDTLPFSLPPSRPSFTRLHVDLKLKVKDEVMNLAQNLAEYRQTCSLFAGLAQDIYRTFRSLRRGRLPRGPASWSQDLANRWLQYQYGLKPLMSDIYKGFEDMSLIVPKPAYRRFKTRKETSDSSFESNPNPYVLIRSEDYSWSLRSRVTAVISPGRARTASEYGLTNPALLVWELIPYSFVIDWMIPVGDTLASLDSLVGVDTIFCENGARLQLNQSFVTKGGGTGSYKYRSVERSLGFEFDLSSAFTYQPSSSCTAVLNGLALLRQLR